MPGSLRPNIAFAGLTAAGKTTHARILAAQLGYEWISATALLLDLLGMSNRPEHVWFTDYKRIQQARADDRVDRELERRLSALVQSRDGLILDSWAMAYIYEGPSSGFGSSQMKPRECASVTSRRGQRRSMIWTPVVDSSMRRIAACAHNFSDGSISISLPI